MHLSWEPMGSVHWLLDSNCQWWWSLPVHPTSEIANDIHMFWVIPKAFCLVVTFASMLLSQPFWGSIISSPCLLKVPFLHYLYPAFPHYGSSGSIKRIPGDFSSRPDPDLGKITVPCVFQTYPGYMLAFNNCQLNQNINIKRYVNIIKTEDDTIG